MATRVELEGAPGVFVTIPEGKTLDDAKAAAIQAGVATAAELFPRPDILAAEQEAVRGVAGEQGIVPGFLAGTRGRMRSIAAGLASPEASAAFEAQERGPIRALLGESTAAQAGAVLPDVGLLGRLGFRGGVTGEAATGAAAAPPGRTLIGALEGAGGAVVGEGIGRGVGLGIRGVTQGVRSTLDFARKQADDFRAAREAAAQEARDAAGIIEDVPPVETGQELLDRARGASSRIVEAEGLGATGDVNIPDERARLVDRAEDLGFSLTTGQRTGSIPQQQVDAGFASNPLTARPFAEASEGNNRQYARTLLRAIGETSGDAVTPQALGRANERIGGEFRDVAAELGPDALAGGKVRLTGELTQAMRAELSDPRIAAKSADNIPLHLRGKTVSPTLQNIVTELDSGAPISGDQLMAWRSALTDDVARFSEQGSGALGTATTTANRAINAIDDAIVRTAGDDVALDYMAARNQWRVLMAAENVLRDPLGEVSAKRMNAELLRNYPQEYRRGGLTGRNPGQRTDEMQSTADFFDATRIGAGILPEVVANSGTPTRQFITAVMQQTADQPVQAAARLGRQAIVGDALGSAAFNRGRVIGPPFPALDVLPLAGRTIGGVEASAQEIARTNQQTLLDAFFGPDAGER